MDKDRKYSATCALLCWSFIPFVADCYGGLGERATAFVTKFIRLDQAQEDISQRRGVEASIWQTLSITLARETARQLAWGALAQCDVEMDISPRTHTPYILPP
jgi:hypothetical protein